MTVIATGVNKKLIAARQPGLGQAAVVGGGTQMRRVTSTLDLKKATYTSKELRPSQQRSDMRHGTRSVDGAISGELSVASYQMFIESILRQGALPATTVAAAAGDIVAASTGTNTGTFTATAGSFMAGVKFKIGMVVRASGFTAPALANNGANVIITSLTDKQMGVARLDGQPIVAKVEAGAVTIAEVGKHTYVPQTGQTRDYYTIEHYFSDIGLSERFVDSVISQMDVKLPATGMATIDFNVMGLNMVPTSGAGYFTNPAAAATGSTLASANGAIYLGGVAVGLITGMNFSVKGNYSTPDGIVGSNVMPDIFPGSVDVDGQVTVLFTDATVRDYFLNEAEVSLYAVFTADNTPNSAFQAYTFPRVKMGGAGKDDGEKGLVMTMPFTALENVNGGPGTSSFATTVVVQDSAFV